MNSQPRLLSDLYATHGIRQRKHLGIYPTWTARALTVVDLDPEDRAVLETDGDLALDAHLRSKGQFPFPALTIRELKPLLLETPLVSEASPGKSPGPKLGF